ncbi:hypothetical protein D3C78_724720 [compost metagenome]
MAAGLGADRGEGFHLGAVLAHVLATGATEGDQVARNLAGIGTQLVLDGKDVATRNRPIREVGLGRAGLHLLEADRQGALDLTALYRGARQIEGTGTGGAGIVDVEHRNGGAADTVQGSLAAGGVAVDVAGKRHLHLVVVQSGILQRQAHGVAAHLDVAGARSRLGEGDHADAGYYYLVAHAGLQTCLKRGFMALVARNIAADMRRPGHGARISSCTNRFMEGGGLGATPGG